VETTARRVEVPRGCAAAQSAGDVSSGTSAVAFALALDRSATDGPGRTRSAEQWARAVFEGAPASLRWCIVFGWRAFLGLRLQPLDGADQVLGWKVEQAPEPDRMVLAADSPVLQAENIVAVDESVVLWVTVVRFHSRIGRLLWGMASPVHQLTIPFLLSRAARGS
jgi:Protein of unknown function (DUF2867)